MKEWAVTKTLLLLLGTLALVSCSSGEKPRIAIAGLAVAYCCAAFSGGGPTPTSPPVPLPNAGADR